MMAQTATRRAESRRQYAARPKQTRSTLNRAVPPKTQLRGAPKMQQPKAMPGDGAELSVDSVPDREFWDEVREHLIERQGMAPDAAPLDSAGCISLAKRYIKASLDDKGKPLAWSSPSTVKKLTSMDFPPAHLHYIAVQLLALREGDRPAPPALMRLSMRMLDHASILDHQPSTLTLCLTALKLASVDGATKRLSDMPPPFGAATSRFRARFRTSGAAADDPDTLAVWGLMHFFEGSLETAESYLRRAMGSALPPPAAPVRRRTAAPEAPKVDVDLEPRPPRFDAEPAAIMALASATARLGRPAGDTAACLAVGAFQLDLATACLQLGLMTGIAEVEDVDGGGKRISSWCARYTPHREFLLTKAAMNGLTPACVAMVDIERFKAAEARAGTTDLSACGLGPVVSAQYHDMIAAEWERVVKAAKA
ncbi:hypothetical protein RB595_000475 [Gaeumannomyces hyphopodioides]